jgi:hypothetical protein
VGTQDLFQNFPPSDGCLNALRVAFIARRVPLPLPSLRSPILGLIIPTSRSRRVHHRLRCRPHPRPNQPERTSTASAPAAACSLGPAEREDDVPSANRCWKDAYSDVLCRDGPGAVPRLPPAARDPDAGGLEVGASGALCRLSVGDQGSSPR